MQHDLNLELAQLHPTPGQDLATLHNQMGRLDAALERLPSRQRAKDTLIGIDPAFRANGFGAAIILPAGEVWLKTFGRPADFYTWALSEAAPHAALVCVENSYLQNATFDLEGSKMVVARKSRNVGFNQAISQAVVEFCQVRWGAVNVRQLSPQEKGSKWTEVYFNAVLKQEGHHLAPAMLEAWPHQKHKANQDERDAYKLALLAAALRTQPALVKKYL